MISLCNWRNIISAKLVLATLTVYVFFQCGLHLGGTRYQDAAYHMGPLPNETHLDGEV